MNKWIIAKEFAWDYGHKVHTQILDAEYSIDTCTACRYFHGHRGTLIVYLEGTELNPQGMVTDFKHLNWLKKFIDEVLDHKMILDIDDPALFHSFSYATPKHLIEQNFNGEKYWIMDPEFLKTLTQPIKEIYEGLILVPFVPTSENLCQWLYKIVSYKMENICKVSRIQFFETPKSQSNYYAA